MRYLASCVALSCLAHAAYAQVSALGYGSLRWGSTPDQLGVAGLNAKVEDFEDVDLEPGLQISWQSPAGNVGPVSVLPGTFNPSTDDAFGTAFVGGAWSGSRCLVNTRFNDSIPYAQSTGWGNVTFHFDPPVRVAGFSIHQMETSASIRVNGNLVTTTSSVGGGFANGSARNGYIVLKADGAELISTITIVNGINPSGDGFTIDQLAFSAQASPVVRVTGLPPAQWGVGDEVLGYQDAVVENFEDAALMPGVQVEWQSPAGNVGPVSVLPNTFAPVTDDPHGNAFDNSVWDGTRALVNVRNNVTFTYAQVDNWGDLILHFNPPAFRLGFSCGDMDMVARLHINGRDVGDFVARTGLPFGPRQGYTRISSLDGLGISTLRIANGRASFNDGIAIDHLVIAARCAPDLNADGSVDDTDFVLFTQQYEVFDCGDPAMPDACSADFSGDGFVDDFDFVLFTQSYAFFDCP